MFTVERKVGRLIEARVHELRDAARADVYGIAIRDALASAAPARGIICADHRPVRIYPPGASERLVSLFLGVNASILRAALVISPTNATFAMQVQRIIRESENPLRRVFLDAATAVSWLAEIATPAELAAARAHLGLDGTVPPSIPSSSGSSVPPTSSRR